MNNFPSLSQRLTVTRCGVITNPSIKGNQNVHFLSSKYNSEINMAKRTMEILASAYFLYRLSYSRHYH